MSFFKSLLAGLAYSAVSQAVSNRVNPAPQTYAAIPAPQPQPVQDDGVPFYEKRVFGTPGASLYSATALSVEARQAGIDGESAVARELERLSAFYPNTYVFHSVKLPGHNGDIDHLVIQGSTMLLVDSKNWKYDAHYHIYHSTFDGDFVSRDGEDFTGGEIHLSRQIAEWQVEFMDSSLNVEAVLVIANRKSQVSESINAPYSFANLTGLATIFGNLFSPEGAAPMHPVMLNRVLSLVQAVGAPQPVPVANPNGVLNHAPSRPLPPLRTARQRATAKAKWLTAWSFFNYTVMMVFFPIAGISAIPLLIMTHRHLNEVRKNGLGGEGLLRATLAFTYILLFLWGLIVFTVMPHVLQGGK